MLIDQIMLDYPTGYWPLDDGSGTPKDRSGLGHDLVLNAGANSYVTDPVLGTGVDGTAGDWATGVNVNQTQYTLEAFVFPVSATPTVVDQTPLADWGGAASTGVMLVMNNGLGAAANQPAAYHAGTRLDSNLTLAIDAWHQLAVTWDGATRRLYVDGVQVNSDAITGAPGTSGGTGAAPRLNSYGNPTVNRRVMGNLAHCAMFAAALPSARIMAHFLAVRRLATVPG